MSLLDWFLSLKHFFKFLLWASLEAKKTDFIACKQQRRRSAYVSAKSD